MSNTFSHNFAGMKGSAIAIAGLSELQILSNNITENGPVTSFREVELSPYYKYLALGNKTLSMNKPTTFGGCTLLPEDATLPTNEFEYSERCYNALYNIDMPPMTGAVHVENCEGLTRCYGPVYDQYYTD